MAEQQSATAPNPWGLTARQAEVMDALCTHGCAKAAARALGIGHETVRSHQAQAAAKIKGPGVPRLLVYLEWATWRKQSELEQRLDLAQKRMDYLQAAREGRRPSWVPKRVRLHAEVRADFPIGHNTVAPAGDHDCTSNGYGAVSITALNGQQLGIKPAEFEVLEWRAN